jgi:uncharacterized membrane protein YfcA
MRSNRAAARAAIFFGAVAVLAIPAAVVLSRQTSARLLESLYVAVPVAVGLGLISLALARRARFAVERSVRPERPRLVRFARAMAWLGVYAGVTGALALGVYGLLRFAQG